VVVWQEFCLQTKRLKGSDREDNRTLSFYFSGLKAICELSLELRGKTPAVEDFPAFAGLSFSLRKTRAASLLRLLVRPIVLDTKL
jgi:hypothetical protein